MSVYSNFVPLEMHTFTHLTALLTSKVSGCTDVHDASLLLLICIAYVSLAVSFRLLVFRPFVNEVIVGRIASCSESGLKGLSLGSCHSPATDAPIARLFSSKTVSLGFFQDIQIPPLLLQQEEGETA